MARIVEFDGDLDPQEAAPALSARTPRVSEFIGELDAPSAPAAPALPLPEQPAKQSALADLADSDTGVEKVAAPKGPAFADTAIGRTVTGALESATRGLRLALEPRRGNRGPQTGGLPNRPVVPNIALQSGGVFEAPVESYADLEARNPQDAKWSAVVASLPARARASLGKSLADSQRLLGSYEAQLSNLEASLGTDFEKRYPNNPNAQEMRRLRDEIAVLKMVSAQFQGDTQAATPKNETLPQKALGSLAESAFPTVAGLAVGAATRSPALAMILAGGGGGAMEASSTYGEAIDKGATPQVATRAGILNGILEGVGEAIPLGIALRPGSPLRARVWNVIGAEAGQEVATQVMQDLNNKLSFDPNMRFDEAVDNALVAAMSGAMGGALYGGVGAALQKAAEQPAKEMAPAPAPLRPVTPALDAALADKPAVRALVQSPYVEPAFAQGAVQGPMTVPSNQPALDKSLSNGGGRDSKSSSNGGQSVPGEKQLGALVDVPTTAPAGRDVSTSEGVSDRTVGDVEASSDAPDRQAGIAQGDSVVDGPGQTTKQVPSDVLGLVGDNQVRDVVVEPVPVDVVNDLGGKKLPPDRALDDKAMLESLPPNAVDLNADKPVASGVSGEATDVPPGSRTSHDPSAAGSTETGPSTTSAPPAAPKPTAKPAEVTSETARRAEFKLTSGAAAKVIETAQRGRFTVSVAGESYGSFVMDDAGKVSNIKARANWAMRNVTEAANTFAAGQRGETTPVADAAKPSPSAADAASVSADDFDALINEVQAERKPPEAKPPRAPKASEDQEGQARLRQLREHFAIGNVIRSAYWRDHDRVIAFDEGNDRTGWSVTVQKVEKKGDEWVPVPGERPRVHSTMPSPKDEIVYRAEQAAPSIKDAAKHAAEGVKEGFAGLDALFGRKGTLGSGPAFDEETWAKAKPHFEAAFREFVAAGKSLKEFVRYILDTYNDAVVPYLKRWHADHVKALDEQPQTTGTTGDRPLEGTPSQDAREPATGGDAGVDSAAGGRDDAAGSGDAGGAGLPAGSGMGDGQGAVRVPPGGEGQQPGTGDQRGVRDGGGDQSRPGQSGDAGGRAGVGLQHVPSTEDYRITDLTRLGEGGQKTKYRDNVAAIRLLKDLEATGRRASQDEQNTLARYVGWGGIAQAFDPDNTSWAKEFAELRALLTDEEYDQARRSTRYAHYTSQQIIVDGIYAALQRFGFAGGGKMLEPGGGVGNFIGLMPEGVRTGSRFTLVEREPIAAGIAKHLYPQQSVILQDFTEFNAANGYYDVVAGNPPFARTALTDMSGRKHLTGMSIHNYFLAKSVDLLRPGGVLAVVVSNYFMDAAGDRARQYIGERTRFLGAIRLPNNAFSRNALTEVTTDLIFLQKLPEKEWGGQAAKKAAAVWLDTGTKVDPLGGAPMPLNAYFIAHPEMMLGRMERSGSMYGPGQPALVAVSGQDTGALLRAAVAKLPADVYKSAAEQNTKAATDDLIEALESPEVHEGGYFVRDGKLYERVDDVAGEARARVISPETRWSEKQLLGQSRYERLIKLANLRQTLRKLIALEMEDAPKVQISTLRQRLNAQYDAYVKAHGFLNDRGTLSLFGDDPDYPLIAALEHNFDPGVGKAAAERQGIKPVLATAKKAPIFDRRVIEPRREVRSAETPADALVISLAERGRIDTALIGKLLGRDGEEVLRELAQGDKPLLFMDPATQEYTLRDAYLSGNVRLKLAQAQAAGMGQNARALEEVIPKDVPAHEIGARVGSPWIPTDVYEQFASELLGDGTTARVRYVRANASFLTTFHAGSEVADSTTYGTDRASASDILTALMNNREIKVYDTTADDRRVLNMEATEAAQDKARAIKDRFEDWVFSDPDRADKLARVYNDTMNNYVTRRFDGAMLTFPGKVPDSVIKFRRHQRDAIARIVQDRTALLDHVVGAGKTFTIVAGAMELKRTGLARKPLIAVPNHLVKQWAADFYRLYPGANILTATKKDFERQNRRKFLGRVATGNWDAVIIAHSSFAFIRPDPGFEEQFNAKQIANIVAAIADLKGEKSTQSRRTVKQLEALKERLEQRIKRLRDKPVDDLLDYGQLGVDQLFIDEAHCLPFDAIVQTDRGALKIGEIVERRLPVQVLSRDLQSGANVWKPVVEWHANERTHQTVRVVHEHGELRCTANHKVWTVEDGYVDAGLLRTDHTIAIYAKANGAGAEAGGKELHPVRSGVQVPLLRREEQCQASALQQSLRSQVADGQRGGREDHSGAPCGAEAGCGPQARHAKPRGVGAHEARESHANGGRAQKDGGVTSWADVSGARWEREEHAAATGVAPCNGVPDGARHPDAPSVGAISVVAKSLQGGPRGPSQALGDRGGRQDAPPQEMAILGRQEDRRAQCSRVVRVESYERGGRLGHRSGGRADRLVYCLTVADTHNFYADGVLVSNSFKNLMFITRMQNVRGLGQPDGSQRAYDMYLKTQQTMARNGRGQGVVFATGTPISNSLGEMYHMLRYLAPETLSDLGHDTFDAWANTFAEVEQVWMQSLTGQGYKSTNRLGKFANAPELLRIFDQVADTVTIEDIKKAYAEENEGREFPIPALKGGRRQPVSIPISAEQKAFMGKIAERAVTMQQRKGPPKKGDDNMLSIMTDARKAAMDVRLVEPSIVDRDPKGRIAIAAGNIVERYRKYADVRGTQLVFSDMGTPIGHAKKELVEYQELQEKLAPASDEDIKARAELGDEAAIAKLAEAEAAAAAIEAKGMDWLDAVKAALRGFSIYDDLRSALIEQGIPAEEIAFIHDYNTDDQKAALFRAVNAGKIRVLMGSTEKMGAGTNVQERAVALHHLDVPWKPSDVEQREGRIIRQGNKLPDEIPGFEVEVMAYATQDTLDLFMWQTQEKKLAMIGQLRTRKVGREIENSFEEMQMSAGEMQAAATSNPYLLEEIQLKDRVKRLERQQRQFDAQKSEIAAKKRKANEQLERLPRQIADAKRFAVGASAYMESLEKANAEMTASVAGKEVVGRDQIGQAIINVLDSFRVPAKELGEKATEAEHEKALADAKKATAKAIKEKGIEFNGTVYRSQSAVSDAYREFAGDRDPIRVTIDGKVVLRRSEAGQMIEQRVTQAMRTDEDVDVGALGEIRISAELARDSLDRQNFVVTVTFDGVDLNGTVYKSDAMTRADLGAAMVGRAHDLVQGSRSNANWLESDLARAERTLRDIEANQMDGEWSERDALAQARAKHQEVLKKLATFGKEPSKQQPDEDAPRLSRAGDDVRFAANVVTELAATDEVFRYPVSKSSDLDAVMAEVLPDAESLGNATRPEEDRDSGADRRFMFRTAAGHDFYVYERGRDVWIDVSELEKGEGGSAIYAAVLNYAHNAKKRLIGDPKGLSVDAIIRRTSAMLSSALRFGTTRHMAAATEQMAGDPEARIAPLKWGGSDAENVRNLIDSFLETLYARVPDLRGMRYDFGRQQFIGSDGARVRQEDFERLSKETGPRDARAGEGTLRRGVLLQSLVSSEVGQRPGILQAVLSRAATLAREGDLRGIFSRRSDTETPADAGVSASVGRVSVELEARMGRPADALGVRIVATWKDLPNGRASFIESRGAFDVQGMFDPDTGETYLVAANIQPGRAFAVYLHELGVHKGLRDLLGDQRFTALAGQIKAWARGVGTAEEVRLAKVAAARVPADTSAAVADEELIAYFVEEAVNAGHDIPEARPQRGRLAQWLHDLWKAVRGALEKLGVAPDTLTAAEVVTLARGAAERAAGAANEPSILRAMTSGNPAAESSQQIEERIKAMVAEEMRLSDEVDVAYEAGDENADALDAKLAVLRSSIDDMTSQLESDLESSEIEEVGVEEELAGTWHDWKSQTFQGRGWTEQDVADRIRSILENNGTSFQRTDGVTNEQALAIAEDAWQARTDRGARIRAAKERSMQDPLLSRAGFRQVQQAVSALFHNDKTFNWWHRTIGTQYHKAQIDRDFGRVFRIGQDYLQDVNYYSAVAEEEAPDLLLRLETPGDLVFRHRISAKNARAIAAPIFEGTLNDTVWTDDELRQRYSLTDKQIDFYRQFRAATDRSLDEMAKSQLAKMARAIGIERAGIESLRKRGLSLADFQQEIAGMIRLREQVLQAQANGMPAGSPERAQMEERVASLKKQRTATTKLYNRVAKLKRDGYAPLMRFGQYTVDVVDAAGDRQFFGMYETQIGANRAARQMVTAFPGSTITTGILSREQYRAFQGLTPETVNIFGRVTGLADDALFQEYLRMAVNNRSALKRLIHRKEIPGFSEDVTRVLASFITSNARLTAANFHAGDMLKATIEIPKAKGDVRDEAEKLRRHLTDPQEEGAMVRGWLFATYLGGSVAAALVNLSQPVMMTAPHLTQFTNPVRVSAEMTRASMESATGRVGMDVRGAYDRAKEEGVVAPHEIYQLMAEASGRVVDRWAVTHRLTRFWGGMFSLAEAFNRRITFIAAYRIAVHNKVPDPYQFAVKVVQETQGIYNKGNRPNWARGTVGATVFCVDDKTEALTQRGWVGPDDLRPGDMIASFDMNAETLVWRPVAQVFVKEHCGEMVHATSRTLDMLMTPDHRVVHYKRRRTKGAARGTSHWELGIDEARNIPATNRVQIPTSAQFDHQPVGAPIPDSMIPVIGWVVTEGHILKRQKGREEWGGQVYIGQNESGNADLIRQDLMAAALSWKETTWNYKGGNKTHVRFCLKKSETEALRALLPNKHLRPEVLMRMTKEQVAVLVDRMLRGDGSVNASGVRSFIQNPGLTLDTFTMALTILGKSYSVRKHGRGCMAVLIRDPSENKCGRYSITSSKRVAYNGRVWCPIVPGTSTWVARRNGMPFITHNTFKQFSIAYLEWWKRLPPKQRLLVFVMLYVAAGLQGIPFADDLEDLIDAMGQWLGYGTNTKKWLRQNATRILGEDGAQFVLHGISAGLPLDISTRLGLGNLIPGTAMLKRSETQKADDLAEVFGPAGGVVGKLVQGKVGDALLPKAYKDGRDAVNMWTTEEFRDSKGRLVLDDVTGTEAIVKGVGFNPSRMATAGRVTRENVQDINLVKATKTRILDDWSHALLERHQGKDGWEKKLREAQKDLKEWNDKNPEMRIRIEKKDIQRRMREIQTMRADRITKTAPKSIRKGVAEDLRQ